MIYGIFKCYNFHFNNYVGFSIIIKNGNNRTTFFIGETLCLGCTSQTIQIVWEIPPFVGSSDLVVSQGFPEEQSKGFNASFKDGKATLSFVVSDKLNRLQVVRCLDGIAGGFSPISSIIIQINGKKKNSKLK